MDLDPPGERPDRELAELAMSVRAAEQAVRYQDELLRERVLEVQALDGMLLAVWTRLWGSRERRLAEGIARVEAARAGLARAKATLGQAHAALAEAKRERHTEQQRRLAFAALVERRATLLRSTTLPAAQDLRQIEAEIELLRTRIRGYDEVLQAGAGLLATIGTALRRVDHAEIDQLHRRKRSRTDRLADDLAVRSALATFADRVARLEKVVRAVGLSDWRSGELLDMREMTMYEIADWIAEYRRELSDQLESLGSERQMMRDRLEALDAARVRVVNLDTP